jgi:hypothetical protein
MTKPLLTNFSKANTIAAMGKKSLPSNVGTTWIHSKPVPVCNASTRELYRGEDLRPVATRPGAMHAYTLPSRTNQHRTWPDGRAAALAGEQTTPKNEA